MGAADSKHGRRTVYQSSGLASLTVNEMQLQLLLFGPIRGCQIGRRRHKHPQSLLRGIWYRAHGGRVCRVPRVSYVVDYKRGVQMTGLQAKLRVYDALQYKHNNAIVTFFSRTVYVIMFIYNCECFLEGFG